MTIPSVSNTVDIKQSPRDPCGIYLCVVIHVAEGSQVLPPHSPERHVTPPEWGHGAGLGPGQQGGFLAGSQNACGFRLEAPCPWGWAVCVCVSECLSVCLYSQDLRH